MKKNEITFIRLMSLAGIIGLNFLILILFAGENVFQNIINNMNNNVYDIESGASSIYNLYYYMGLNVVYKVIFPITVFVMGVAFVSVLLRINKAGWAAMAANVCSLITGIFLLFARVYEGSVGVHKFIDGFYMENVISSQIETAQFMPKFPITYILVIIISVLGLLMIRSSKICRIKAYNNDTGIGAVNYMIPGMAGFVILQLFRDMLCRIGAGIASNKTWVTYTYIKDYYIGSNMFFSLSWMMMFMIVTCVAVIIKHGRIKKLSDRKIMLAITVLIPSLIVLAASVIYYFNPPGLFGVLTLDVELCDMTENAFLAYLIRYSISMISVFVLIYMTVNDIISTKKLLLVSTGNALLSFVLIVVVKGISVASGYYLCALIDVITMVSAVIIRNKAR
ncbi:MAG: hypothetical protein ACI4D4_09870 [Lachnospira sp.]